MRAHYKIHIWHAYCILVESATLIVLSCFVNRLRKMVSFELGKEIEKDVFFILSWTWDKEKLLSPHEESNLRPLNSVLWCSTTKPQSLYGEQGLPIFLIPYHISYHLSYLQNYFWIWKIGWCGRKLLNSHRTIPPLIKIYLEV